MKVLDLGLTDYLEGWRLQREIFDRAAAAKAVDFDAEAERKGFGAAEQTLILCEHPHVYTLGRNGRQSNLLASEEFLESIGAKFYRIDRGGDVTYHGPGQLVAYPIVDLDAAGMGVRSYIHALEQAVIDTLGALDIAAGRTDGAAGVWIPGCEDGCEDGCGDGFAGDGRLSSCPPRSKPLRKICAIGVRASHGVTMHGLALNVSTRLEYFSYINPCGFVDRGVTSIEAELGRTVEMGEVKRIFVKCFERAFGMGPR
ncbi:MAG: lipoyl(octanoyl) transferase LipB [Rikenellaceae bacterium]|jgi:lipoyl(octanoyl) transferase|nr:lipoyl(octanoyl) transferase LipB [Rikenellaceae bacterium]